MEKAGGGAAFVPHDVKRQDRPDGSIMLTTALELGPVAQHTGEWLHRWANEAPSRVFVAERSGDSWREESYSAMLGMVRAVAASLLARGLDGTRPIIVLSGNSIDHAVLALAAQYVGVPVVPLAEQYSLIPEAHDRLRFVIEKVRPALAYVSQARTYASALALDCLRDIDVVAGNAEGATRPVTPFAELLKGRADGTLDEAHTRVGPDTLAKILFTSGSTSNPKGVRTTQRMMCVNQAQIAACLPLVKARPPKILDWLPWNHVFGGSHNFNMMLANGGSLYIDDGKPVAHLFPATLRNLREHAGNLSFNVPLGYALLVAALREDQALRRSFFNDLDLIFYAGASLPQDVWQALEEFALQERGCLPFMTSSWGMTETAPAALIVHQPVRRSGVIGVPMPQTRIKLIPDESMRCELRVAGPQVMDGYHEDAERTAASFDEEGFFITGDAVRLVEAGHANTGLAFDGRLSDDFKLMSGTWVHASNLRLEALKQFARIAQDIVIAAPDRPEIGVLVFPNKAALAAAGLAVREHDGVLCGDELAQEVLDMLNALAEHATGASMRIARALVLAEPPSVRDHEITAKGNLNNRNVLKCRAALVDRLYDDTDPAVIRI